jgi:GNAT superfamily N-acetyltransferase
MNAPPLTALWAATEAPTAHLAGCLQMPRVRRLSAADLDAVDALQRQVGADLPAGFMRSKGEHELMAYLDGTHGRAYGIVGQGAVWAMALLRIPSPLCPNPGPPFPRVPATDWPRHAALLENAMVHPRMRGRGLQRALTDVRIAYARAAGMRWVCAGVHFDNLASWRNLLANGMRITDSRERFGRPLLALLRPFDEMALPSNPGDRRWVRAQDAAGHRSALQAGYLGVGFTPDRCVVYQRLGAVPCAGKHRAWWRPAADAIAKPA